MAYNGTGNFLINSAGQPVVSGTTITSTAFNALTADLATGLSTCVTKDGQTTTTAIVPFGGGGIKTDVLSPFTPNGPVSLTAGQLLFPASANLSSNANTLDDYEEGTWTPTMSGTSVAGAPSYTTQFGSYTKIGNLVTVFFDIQISAKGGMTGNVLIGGLPFTSSNAFAANMAVGAVSHNADVAYEAGYTFIVLNIQRNTTTMLIAQNGSGLATKALTVTPGLGSTAEIVGTMSYNV